MSSPRRRADNGVTFSDHDTQTPSLPADDPIFSSGFLIVSPIRPKLPAPESLQAADQPPSDEEQPAE